MRRPADLALRALVRLALGVFFRRVELVGAHRLPPPGARIYVGNHYNSLIDPGLVLGWLPGSVRMLAKSTLWRQFPAGLFVRLAGAVPVYRPADAGVDASRNVEMFESCWQILGRGGSIALFPEGLSHNEPRLQPLKTGAARIALGALARQPETPLVIVPFGLVFEERERFRSRALIEIGHPIEPRAAAPDLAPAGDENDAAAVRALTETIARRLAAVTLNYESWQEAELVRRAADLWVSDQQQVAAGPRLSPRLPYQRAFAEGYGTIKELFPEATAAVRRRAEAYSRLLDLTGLTDRQVISEYPAQLVARFLARSVAELLVLLPAGLAGTLLNWLPYAIPRWTVRLLPLGRDLHATYKLMISLLLFPATWLATAYAAWRLWGAGVALPLLVVAPLSGYVALLLKERLERLVLESRAYLMLRGRGSLAQRLRERREELLRSIRELVEAYRAAQSS
jgi:1-acyl-sn-glycerol-3-phosphate acyltransferase